ncbi:MAG TPA: hypothetical protein VHJ34_08010 [Actinomycetota bacterium]|nr:hypothetical protein [Actinomycetota bacterium]
MTRYADQCEDRPLTGEFLALVGIAWMLVYAAAAVRARRNAPLSTTEQFRRAMEVITPDGVPPRFVRRPSTGAGTTQDGRASKALAASETASGTGEARFVDYGVEAGADAPAPETTQPAASAPTGAAARADDQPRPSTPRPATRVRSGSRARPAPRVRSGSRARSTPRGRSASRKARRPAGSTRSRLAVRRVAPASRRAADVRERALAGLCVAVPATALVGVVGGGGWWTLPGACAAALALYVSALLEDKHRRDERRRKVRSLAARRAAYGRRPAAPARASGRR